MYAWAVCMCMCLVYKGGGGGEAVKKQKGKCYHIVKEKVAAAAAARDAGRFTAIGRPPSVRRPYWRLLRPCPPRTRAV